MGIRHLRIFVAVYQLGSITMAARQLHLAQPSVSLAIRELEEAYGVRLFDRISRRLHRTQSGAAFYGYAARIVALYDEMERTARAQDACALLRAGASVTVGTAVLPEVVRRFGAQHPEVEVQVTVGNAGLLNQLLVTNQLDLAFLEGPAAAPQLQQLALGRKSELLFIAKPGHPVLAHGPLSIGDLAAHPFLLREKGSAARAAFDALMGRHGLEVTPAWESTSTQALIGAAAAGLGLALLPEPLARAALERGDVVRVEVEDAPPAREFFAVFHKNKYLPRAAQDLIALCRKGEEKADK